MKLFNLLDQLVEERGVPKAQDSTDKNILKSENSPFDTGKRVKIKGNLLPNERRRLVEAYKLFNKMFFDYEKKDKKDIGDKTLVTKIATTQRKASVPPIEKKSSPLMSMILGGLALLGVGIIALVGGLKGWFGDGGGVAQVVAKLGLFGALKFIAKAVGKRFAKSVLKRLPIIGGIVSFAFAVKAFKDGKIALGISEIISGLLIFVPGVGPMLSLGADILIAWAEAKEMFSEGGALSNENGWNTVKKWASDIWDFIWNNGLYLPIIGGIKRFGMAWDSFKSGSILQGVMELQKGVLTFMGQGGIVYGWDVLMGWLDTSRKVEIGGETKSETGWGTLKRWASNIWDFIWNNGLYLPIIGGIKRFGMAWDAFESGKLLKGVMELQKGVLTFMGQGGIVYGWDVMMGWLNTSKQVTVNGESTSENGWQKLTRWATNIGKWIWDKALGVPVLATVKRFGMASDKFGAGNVVGGLYELGMGILSLGPAPLVRGIELLLGLDGDKSTQTNKLVPDTSWHDKLHAWIQDKLEDLPDYLQAPLKWFGIIENNDYKSFGMASVRKGEKGSHMSPAGRAAAAKLKKVNEDGLKNTAEGATGLWDTISDGLKSAKDGVVKQTKKGAKKTETFMGMAMNVLGDEISKNTKGMFGDSKNFMGDAGSGFTDMLKDAGNSMSDAADGVQSWVGSVASGDSKKSVSMDSLYDSSEKQVKLLSNLVNLTVQALRELQRMAGGGSTVINFPNTSSSPAPQQKGSSINMYGNRDAYQSSAYALS